MDTQLIVRIIVSIVTFINLLATSFGFDPLNLDEGTIYTVVSAIAVLVSWIWGFWKNNNFTEAAKYSQTVLDGRKDAEKSKE